MLPASNRGAGMNIGFPDICLTPAVPAPIPTPYPNFAMNAMAAPFAVTVWVSMMNALNLISMIPMTSGDEAGSASPIKGPGRYTMGNPIVYVELMPAINLLCPTTGNNMINALGAVLVPSLVNVFYTHRAGESVDSRSKLDLAQITSLGDAMSAPEPVGQGVLRGGAVGVVAVRRFTIDVSALVHREIAALSKAGMAALVIDLRGCPGGDLDACLRLADDFVERGSVLGATLEADGDALVHRARQGDPYTFPVALLVDRDTASAAEIFAGSLQQNGRALVIGERTHGKGTAQKLLPGFAEPGAHYATVASFALPDGEPLDGRGIRPDLEVPSTAALDAAVDALTHLLSTQEVR